MGVLQRLGITYLIGSLIYLGIIKLNNKNVTMLSDFTNEVVGFRAWVTYEFITPCAGQFYDSIIFSSLYAMIWIIIILYMYIKNKFIKI